MRENGLIPPATGVATARVPVVPFGMSGALVPHQKRPPMLAAAERALVLHKDLVLRIGVLALAAVLVAGGIQMRGRIADMAMAGVEAASTGLASAGFGISAIDITGQALTSEAGILGALDIAPGTSLLAFDAEAARQRLVALPAVTEAHVRKAYPDRLMVSVNEKQPVARWTVDGTTYLVDSAGTKLVATEPGANADLPLVIGQGAADNAAPIIRALARYPDLGNGVVALSRIGDRRWDLLYDTGLRVQLPETGITPALKQLDALERDHAILERDLAVIDLRVSGSTLVRLNPARDEDGAAAN